MAAVVKEPEVLGVQDLTPPTAKWLSLKSLQCRDPQGRTFSWEFVERVTKYRETDGAGVFAKVTFPGQADQLLVIAQWRPPLKTFVLELPAGVIEEGETIEQLVLRELKEETGYVGKITRVTTEVANDQGLTNSCLNFAFATVDGAAPENAHPEPTPELGENIQVLLLPIKGLSAELTRLKQQNNWAIDSRLLAFALGLDFAVECMSGAEDTVNIEHLLVEAMHNVHLPLAEDPLPSAEEIAGARAAATAAHSTCSAAAVPAQPVKGLGGAGLSLKRKGDGKAGGNSSTISAATAPPALLAGGRGGGPQAAAGSRGNRLGSSKAAAGHNTPAAKPAAAGAAAGGSGVDADTGVEVGAVSDVAASGGGRGLDKSCAGVRSFRTVLSPETAGEDSSEWESASMDEGEAGKPSGASAGWNRSLSVLDDLVDPPTLAVCGVVLGACAGAVLVLGASIWWRSRQ